MPSSPSQKASRTTWVNGLVTIPTAAYMAAEGISPTTGPGREGMKNVHLSMCTAHGVCNEVWCRPFPTNLPSPIHHSLTQALRHAQCNNVTLGRRLPIQPSAVGNRSLMWPYHITGTPGCSRSRPEECQHPLTKCSLHSRHRRQTIL